MRFEDEQYVRLYKRDTTTWKMIPWQSRCLLPLILRKLDRAGILDLGEDGLEALAVHIEVPLAFVLEAMPALLGRGVLVLREDGLLVWPKFIEGQEAKQSDKARQKSARDRARDLASAVERGVPVETDTVTPRDSTVTPRDANTTPRDATVTRGHTVSQSVTLSSAQLSSEVKRSTGRPRHTTKESGTTIPKDWTISPALLAWAKSKGVIENDIRSREEPFRDYWLQQDPARNKAATKRDWDAAFRVWVARDIEGGKIHVPPPVARVAVLPPPTAAQLEMRRTTSASVAAAIAEMESRTAGGGA